MNKIVVHYADGRVQKGFAGDFSQNKPTFHLTGISDQKIEIIDINKLKAVFIVKEFEGDPKHREASDFKDSQKIYGARLRIHFKDGEKLAGVGMGYIPEKMGFFMTPCDPDSNILRAFIVNKSIDRVERL